MVAFWFKFVLHSLFWRMFACGLFLLLLWCEWTANSNINTIQQQQQQLPRRVLSNLANTNLNNNEDACRVPNSTVNSLSSTVGSATASVHNNNSSPSAVVPISNGTSINSRILFICLTFIMAMVSFKVNYTHPVIRIRKIIKQQ